jgi:hypothetical protein
MHGCVMMMYLVGSLAAGAVGAGAAAAALAPVVLGGGHILLALEAAASVQIKSIYCAQTEGYNSSVESYYLRVVD